MSSTPDHLASTAAQVSAWAASGAMALTGRADGPALGPPEGLVPELSAIGWVLEDRARELGGCLQIDPVPLLAERAALAGLSRQGATSCGGATRLLGTIDGWIAVALARPEDRELVPAWLERSVPVDEPWAAIAAAAAATGARALVARAVLLGLPVAELSEHAVGSPATAPFAPLPVRAIQVGGAPATPRPLQATTVVDLSSLWAGPLCGSLLADAGATVVKVESTRRPDGARLGPGAFHDLLNAGKRSVALDLSVPEGRRALVELVAGADVVIEGSRPRALEQLGIDARRVVAGGGPRVWVSITGHGRSGADRDRVAFGDDAAVAGGLVAWDDAGPCFCADAIADPVTGTVAATAVLEALTIGGRWLLDVPMAAVAAHLAGPTLPASGTVAAPPAAPRARGRAPALGEHTGQVLAWLAGRR